MYLLVQLPAVQEVEDLHHDEGVEDDCEMPRGYLILFENGLVVRFTWHIVQSTWSNRPSLNQPLMEFILRMVLELIGIDLAHILRDEVFTQKQ